MQCAQVVGLLAGFWYITACLYYVNLSISSLLQLPAFPVVKQSSTCWQPYWKVGSKEVAHMLLRRTFNGTWIDADNDNTVLLTYLRQKKPTWIHNTPTDLIARRLVDRGLVYITCEVLVPRSFLDDILRIYTNYTLDSKQWSSQLQPRYTKTTTKVQARSIWPNPRSILAIIALHCVNKYLVVVL